MKGLILWWSTFRQKWNWTPWEYSEGKWEEDKQETTRYEGKPILSNDQLLKTIRKKAKRLFNEGGNSQIVESAYSAIWCSDKQCQDFLRDKINWLVCHEV